MSVTLIIASSLFQLLALLPSQGQVKDNSAGRCGCDFSKFRPLVVSHPLVEAATKRVEPDYPLIAKEAKIQGKVEVRILVDRKGNVIDACVVEGHPMLDSAAKNAAIQWKFKKNLGFSTKQTRRYIEASLFFTFRLAN
jgi:TonB family protein